VHEHADLAVAYAELGDVAAAMQALNAMRSVPENALTASFWPHYPYWIASRAAAKLGDPAMERELLARAHLLLFRMAAAIEDEPTKAAFLDLTASRAIVAAHARV
jgi:hypothetical protein